jgi:hypothetical protein
MSYVAVDEDGKENVSESEPRRSSGLAFNYWGVVDGDIIYLPKGSIEKLIGKKLTWEDEPVELKE